MLIRPNSLNVVGAGVTEVGATASSDSTEMATGGEDESPGEADEARRPQVARRPITPSKAEVESHLPLHIEYRSWCPHCVAGRGISMQHRQKLDDTSSELGITVSLDYCFMTAEEAEEDMRAVLVCYDHNKSGLWAIPVEEKGANADVVKWVVDKLDEAGYV